MPLIAICSPKGGVGKTMLAANLAHALRRAGRQVLAMDLDPQNALRLHFGVPLADQSGFLAELRSRPDWRAVARRTASGVLLLPYGAVDAGGSLANDQAMERDPSLLGAALAGMLAEPGLTVIADTAPGPSQALRAVLPLADIILVPLLADGGSIAMLPGIESGLFLGRGTLGGLLAARMRIVVNQVEPQGRLSSAVVDALLRRFGPRLIGLVGRDEAVAEALAHGALVADHAPQSRTAADLAEIARTLDAVLPGAATAPGADLPPVPLWGLR